MIINANIENIINSYEPLQDWFNRNEEEIKLIQSSDNINDNDLIILKKMIDSAFKWFNILDTAIGTHARAFNASESIYKIYREEFDNLSEDARIKYSINVHQNNNSSRLVIVK